MGSKTHQQLITGIEPDLALLGREFNFQAGPFENVHGLLHVGRRGGFLVGVALRGHCGSGGTLDQLTTQLLDLALVARTALHTTTTQP